MGLGRVIGSAVVALGIVGVGYTSIGAEGTSVPDPQGSAVGSGEFGTFRVELGDCLNGASAGPIDSVAVVPCSTPHEAEVYRVFALPEGSFPGHMSIRRSATSGCEEAFVTFVDHDAETSIYDIRSLVPSQERWDEHDDREILCLVEHYDGSTKIGSARGTRI